MILPYIRLIIVLIVFLGITGLNHPAKADPQQPDKANEVKKDVDTVLFGVEEGEKKSKMASSKGSDSSKTSKSKAPTTRKSGSSKTPQAPKGTTTKKPAHQTLQRTKKVTTTEEPVTTAKGFEDGKESESISEDEPMTEQETKQQIAKPPTSASKSTSTDSSDEDAESGMKSSSSRMSGRRAVGVSSDDPFSLNPEWALFNKKMDNLTILLIGRMKPVYSLFTAKNEDYKANRTRFLDTFTQTFTAKYMQRLIELLQPVQDELGRNEAFTIVNPAIELRTIAEAIVFAKTNPSGENDKGRLKWMEINSMAANVHYVYKRLILDIENQGLEEVNRTMGIVYPSWVTDFVIKEKENNFQDLSLVNMTAYIHEQMNVLGEPNHLIRILERLLKKMPLSDWNPGETALNMYCYGNNRYGTIHTKYDVLLDAAMYLCLADMKFAILEMTNNVYVALKAEKENGAKFDLEATRDEIEARLKTRVERKYKIAPEPGTLDIDISIAPKRFQCDDPPKGCGESPRATSPYCPPGIYIQDGAVFRNETKIQLPENPSEGVKLDGKLIECIGLEYVPFDKNGTIIPCYLKNGKCVDPTSGKAIEGFNVVLTPVLLDENRVPIQRDNRVPVYPKSSEWGILDCGIHPDPPLLDPPQGGLNKTKTKDSDTTGDIPKLGYEDPRKPNTTKSAQFSNAFPGYLESELVLNPDGKCVGTCRNYRNPTPTCTNKTVHCDLYRKSHCEDQSASDCMKASKCPNKAKRCIRTSREVNYCPAPEKSGRVYDWMKFNDKIRSRGGIDLGSIDEANPSCNGSQVIKVRERWEMESGVILNTPQYCEICLCVCNDPISPDGQHYFDISPRVADTANGFVVTGLRFEQKNNTMSLNIQHGKLLENGKVNESTVTWLEPNPSPQPIPLGSMGFLKMNLDDIHAKFTEVVTGVRWTHSGETLSLEIGVTEFLTKVPSSSSKIEFVGAKNGTMRQRFNLIDSTSPFNQRGPSQPYPITDNSGFYIEFDASSLEKDAGQSVVPFFDLQPILSSDKIPVPLSAVGILYKSKEGSGGFLAPSVRTYVHPYMRELV